MATVLYTTTNSIRAAIGVTDIELTDTDILDCNTEDELILFLDRGYPTHDALKSRIDAGTASADDRKAYRALKLCSMYAGACIALRANQYRFEQQYANGGTSKARFSKDDLETLPARMAAMRDDFLGQALGDQPLTAADFVSVMAVAGRTYDPVTGP